MHGMVNLIHLKYDNSQDKKISKKSYMKVKSLKETDFFKNGKRFQTSSNRSNGSIFSIKS